MAHVDYYGIQEAIQTQLNNSLGTKVLSNQNVSINIEPIDDPDGVSPWIGIYLDNAGLEPKFIAGGNQPYEVNPTFIIECFEFDINEFKNACQRRDNLAKDIIETLTLDLTISNNVKWHQATNINFDIGQREEDVGFFVGAEITLTAELRG